MTPDPKGAKGMSIKEYRLVLEMDGNASFVIVAVVLILTLASC